MWNSVSCHATAMIEIPSIYKCTRVLLKIPIKYLLFSVEIVNQTTRSFFFITDLLDLHTTMLVIAKVFCTLSMAMLRIYTAELLPTALRGSGLGLITAVSYSGANVMPFILRLVSTFFILFYGLLFEK